jgi:uncharacterized damage-inducible protein DinB
MPSPEIQLLLRMIDEAYDRKSWHGTNLRGAIRGLGVDEVSWRPHPRRHNIWEIVLHAAYWKYTVRRRLLGEARGAFPLEGSNWFQRPSTDGNDDKQWKADIAVLAETHRTMRDAVAALGADAVDSVLVGSKMRTVSLITGIAAHDLYHAGQIQLLKRLQADAFPSAKHT